jgi:hypothetical protein
VQLTAEAPGAMLSQLPPSAVTINSPSNNLVPDVCYEEFSIGAPSVHSFIRSQRFCNASHARGRSRRL